ncbi:polysaccharide deacetylase family protein [Leptospira interrogans]
MKRLTYTFDNGPWPGATDKLLDFLKERAIQATFFVVGERLKDPAARRLADRAHAEGHWIGNHTLTHGDPLGMGGGLERVRKEVGETEELLGSLAHPRKYFRPNGGGTLGSHVLSPEAVDYLTDQRYTVVTWNNVPRDWDETRAGWPDRAEATLETQDWSVLVLHDQFIAPMMTSLEDFHDRLVAQSLEIVQEFPESCLPIREGRVVRDISGLVSQEPGPTLKGAFA